MKRFLMTTLVALGLTVYGAGSFIQTAFADDPVPSDDYSVAPVFSEHQDKETYGYFKVPYIKGGEEEIGVKIQNNSNEKKEFSISVNKALTNGNGAVVYNDPSQNSADNAPTINDMVSFPNEITVDANSEVVATGKIDFADTDISGTRMGGLFITEKTTGNAEDGQVNVRYSYALPIVITSNNISENEFTWSEMSFVKQDNGLIMLTIPFENTSENYLKESKIDVSVKDEEGDEVFGYALNDVLITPKTNIPLQVLITEDLPAGDYTVDFTLNFDNLGNRADFKNSQVVTVTKEISKEIEQTQIRTGNKKKADTDYTLIYVGAGLAALSIIAGTTLLAIKTKNKK